MGKPSQLWVSPLPKQWALDRINAETKLSMKKHACIYFVSALGCECGSLLQLPAVLTSKK